MYLSLNVIKNYVKLPDVSPEELAEKLTMSTVEVEGITDQAAPLEGVVVGKVTELVRHPKADRLWVCTVDIKTEKLQVICGGENLSENMLVAFAQVGSSVRWHGKGDPIVLSKAKIRGIESFGMIAASEEIGLERLFPQKNDREILDLSKYDLKVGDPLADALGLTDVIIEIDNASMTHRPDLWGQYGLVREVAALYEAKLTPIKAPTIPDPTGEIRPLKVSVNDKALCSRFMAVVMDNIQPKESPWWLKRDLEAVGIGSKNTIVDVTNYVMTLLGQPMHAYDYETLADEQIVVEQAGKITEFSALNGKNYKVPREALLIRDGKKDIGLAGIIGGANSHISETTKTIVLEAAHFDASSVRRTSMNIGLRTDASSRFEKQLDPITTETAMRLAVSLLLKLHPDARIAEKCIDSNSVTNEEQTVTCSHELIEKKMGITIEEKKVVDILKRLSFGVKKKAGIYTVTVPSYRRRDITIAEDIIEEVARLYGYNEIAPALPTIALASPVRHITSRVERHIKNVLVAGFGFSETYTYSFADEAWSAKLGLTTGRVSVKNSISPDQRYMRTSLLPQLLARAAENTRWYDDFRMFECGRVFIDKDGEYPSDSDGKHYLPYQPYMCSGVLVSKSQKEKDAFLEIKGLVSYICESVNSPVEFVETNDLSHARGALEIKIHGQKIGYMGLIRKDHLKEDFSGMALVWWEIQLTPLVKFADFSLTYNPLPKYPSVRRDIAVLVDTDVTWDQVYAELEAASGLITDIELFDEFVSPKLGQNKKSLAFSLVFSSKERTLESGEVDTIVNSITKKLKSKLNAEIR